MGVERILIKNGIDYKRGGTYYQISCLSPEHEDRNPSMFVNQFTGWANCRSCGVSYNLFDLYNEKANWMQIQKEKFRAKIQKVGMDSMTYEIPDSAVLFNSTFRGISANTMKKFEAFQYSDFPGYLFFPIRNASNKIVNFIGRDTTGDRTPKYLFLHKKPVIMAPYSEPYYSSIILVEGWFDFLNLYEKGLTNVRCLFGTSTFNQEHIDQIKMESIDEVVIMLDGDSSGESGASKMKNMLDEAFVSNKVIKLQQGTDPGDLNAETVIKIKEKLYGTEGSYNRDKALFS